MYYSSGNYEAFARPEKPEGVERKSAYIVGSGLAGYIRRVCRTLYGPDRPLTYNFWLALDNRSTIW